MPSRRLLLASLVLVGCGSDATTTATTTSPDGGTNPPANPDGGSTPVEPTFPEAKGDPCRGIAVSDDVLVPDGLCVRLIAKGQPINSIRQIMFASNGDLFAQTAGAVVLLFRDENGDGSYSKDEIYRWAQTDGNGNSAHVDEAGGYVYAGSVDGVVRFKYDPSKTEGGPEEKVITEQPRDGHGKHTAHVYDGFLYVSSGSSGNATHEESPIDGYDKLRSVIRRFDLSKLDPAKPFKWTDGEVFTLGLRNANGFARNETTKKIYAVVNGLDSTVYKGVDVHNDNPGEQIAEIAKDHAYGYPYCFTAQAIAGGTGSDANGIVEPGTQLFFQNFGGNPHSDEWCKTNSMKPTTFVQAHSAPLDLTFFDRQPKGNLPEAYRGGAFVALHGSWNRLRGQHVGREVVWVPFAADGSSPMPTTKKEGDKLVTTFPYKVIFGPKTQDMRNDDNGTWSWSANGSNDAPRPAGVAISPIDGALYFTSDSGTLYRAGIKK